MSAAALPRVLLVDDDPALQRFVGLALEDQPLQLIACKDVDEAMHVLHQEAVQLIVTDLMLPGKSGLDLLLALKANPALRGSARVVVLSAGLTASKREQLVALEVWSLLDKPVSVARLLACVEEGLAPGAPAHQPVAVPAWPQDSARAHAQTAIDEFFAGDGALYRTYRSCCLAQFPQDLRNGDQACETGDLVALRHLAHNLKSVLRMLGHPHLSQQALALEQCCATGQDAVARQGWEQLRMGLAGLDKPTA